MNIRADKKKGNKSQSLANKVSNKKTTGISTFQFVDYRPEAVSQIKLKESANNSPKAKKVVKLQAMADNCCSTQLQTLQRKENNTGLPDNLKTGKEILSEISFDDVKVHRNSEKSVQLNGGVVQLGKTKDGLVKGLKGLLTQVTNVYQDQRLDMDDSRCMGNLKFSVEKYLAKAEGLADDDRGGANKLKQEWSEYHLKQWSYFEILKKRAGILDDERLAAEAAAESERLTEEERLARGGRSQALRTANDAAIVAIKDAVVQARQTAGQGSYNAGRNNNLTTEGGNTNPLSLDHGLPEDGFLLRDIASNIISSDSGIAKRTFAHRGGNILVHVC